MNIFPMLLSNLFENVKFFKKTFISFGYEQNRSFGFSIWSLASSYVYFLSNCIPVLIFSNKLEKNMGKIFITSLDHSKHLKQSTKKLF